jgi:AcrR family transcriptional regulator
VEVDGRNERKEASRNSILAAAWQLIDDKGVDGFSMRELASVAGVSVATLYNIFESREAIVDACFNKALKDLRPLYDSLADTEDLGALCLALAKAADILCESVSGSMYLKLTHNASIAGSMSEHHATERVVPELEAAVLRGELSLDVDIDELRSVIEAVFFSTVRLEAFGAISAEERRRRIISGMRLVLLAGATELGRSSLIAVTVDL